MNYNIKLQLHCMEFCKNKKGISVSWSIMRRLITITLIIKITYTPPISYHHYSSHILPWNISLGQPDTKKCGFNFAAKLNINMIWHMVKASLVRNAWSSSALNAVAKFLNCLSQVACV